MSLMAGSAIAAPLAWTEDKYSHFSDQEPLADMLKTLSAFQDTPIIVSEKVEDVVSLHYKERKPRAIFDDLVLTHGLIWYYDGETLHVYKEEEAERGSVSLKKTSPKEFTDALKRLEVLDDKFHWEVSEVDNIIYFSGPERFVSSVLNMAQLIDTQKLDRTQVFKWKDKRGVMNYSTEKPTGGILEARNDVRVEERLPSVEVLDIINK